MADPGKDAVSAAAAGRERRRHPRDAGISPQDEALVLPHRPAPDPAGPDRAGGLAEDKVIKKNNERAVREHGSFVYIIKLV